jgi:hypothetical protein
MENSHNCDKCKKDCPLAKKASGQNGCDGCGRGVGVRSQILRRYLAHKGRLEFKRGGDGLRVASACMFGGTPLEGKRAGKWFRARMKERGISPKSLRILFRSLREKHGDNYDAIFAEMDEYFGELAQEIENLLKP